MTDPTADASAASPGPDRGWYVDPDEGDMFRFWDGQRWTEHRSPRFASRWERRRGRGDRDGSSYPGLAEASPATVASTGAASGTGRRRLAPLLVVGLMILVVVGGAVAVWLVQRDSGSGSASAGAGPARSGTRVGDFFIYDPPFERGLLGWNLKGRNDDDVEHSTYMDLKFYDAAGNQIGGHWQCSNDDMNDPDFIKPGKDFEVSCNWVGDERPLPEYDHYTLSLLDGFPANQGERDQQGY